MPRYPNVVYEALTADEKISRLNEDLKETKAHRRTVIRNMTTEQRTKYQNVAEKRSA